MKRVIRSKAAAKNLKGQFLSKKKVQTVIDLLL